MPERFRGSLALRVLGISVLLFALPLLVYFFIVFHQNLQSTLLGTVTRLRDLGRSRAEILTQLNSCAGRTLDIIEEILTLGHVREEEEPLAYLGGDKRVSGILESAAEGGDFASLLFIAIEPGGKFISRAASSPDFIGRNFTGSPFAREVMLEGQSSFLAFGEGSFESYLYTAKLMYGRRDFRPLGILVASTLVDDLIAQLVSTESERYTVNFSLMTRDGVIIASGDPDLVLRQLGPLNSAQLWELHERHGVDPASLRTDALEINPIPDVREAFFLDWAGERRIAVEVPVKGTNFSLLLNANEAQVLGELYARRIHVWLIFGAILLVGGAATFWMTQRMSKPLKNLIGAMHRAGRGNLEARFRPTRMGFEINQLGAIFNDTMDSLGTHMQRAEDERVAKETLRKELEIGKEIQMSLLPHRRAEYPGVEIAARFLPAKEVGGDFYDIFVKEGGDLVLTVADAAGKGISACLYSFTLRSMLRSYCVVHDKAANIMRNANNIFCEDAQESAMFVTAFMAIFHPEERVLTYASCGHTPGLLLRRDGALEKLVTGGMALGIQKMDKVVEKSVQLQPGDLILLYTDGVTEAMSPDLQPFGEERLIAFFKGQRGSAEEIADAILAEVKRWAAGTAQADDLTVMALLVR